MKHPVTPDGRYFVVRGRLWRMSNPALNEAERERHTRSLMKARRDIGQALREADTCRIEDARARVHQEKLALGERGLPWWHDGAPDYNRHLASNTPYNKWYESLSRGKH
jgi:hypothetical protein